MEEANPVNEIAGGSFPQMPLRGIFLLVCVPINNTGGSCVN
jgi:hypothetical protein